MTSMRLQSGALIALAAPPAHLLACVAAKLSSLHSCALEFGTLDQAPNNLPEAPPCKHALLRLNAVRVLAAATLPGVQTLVMGCWM